MVPTSREVAHVIRLCLVCGTGGLASLLLNVVMFLPLGAAIRVRFGSLVVALACGFLLSLGIELTQLMIPGRFTTLADLVANSAGAGLGAVLVVRPSRWLLPGLRSGRALAATASGAAVLVILLTGALFSPSVPEGSIYGQWRPQVAGHASYAGEVVSARIGDVPLPSQLLERQDEVRVLLREGAPLEVRFTVAEPTPRLAPVFRIVAGPFGHGSEAFQVGVDGHDLVVRPRYRADDMRLTRPELRLREALASAAVGDTVRVETWRDPEGGHRVRVGDAAPLRLGVSAGRGWSLLRYIRSLPEWAPALADLLWIGALFLPLGWWAPSRPLLLLLLGAAPLAALFSVPFWSPLLPTPAGHLVAGAAALLLGQALRSAVEQPIRGRLPSPSL